MSKNLNVSLNGFQLDLWETPTRVSYTILPAGEAKGKLAKEALIRYREWVKYSIDGQWESEEVLNEAIYWRDLHLSEIDGLLLNDCRNLKMWIC